jgi:hypothetical protein
MKRFYCVWHKRWTDLKECKSCYDYLRGECFPKIEEKFFYFMLCGDKK